MKDEVKLPTPIENFETGATVYLVVSTAEVGWVPSTSHPAAAASLGIQAWQIEKQTDKVVFMFQGEKTRKFMKDKNKFYTKVEEALLVLQHQLQQSLDSHRAAIAGLLLLRNVPLLPVPPAPGAISELGIKLS